MLANRVAAFGNTTGLGMRAIEVSDLERWADRKDCKERLPELVRRLIEESCVSGVLEPAPGDEPNFLTKGFVDSAWAPEKPAYWVMSNAGSPSRAADVALARWKSASQNPAVGNRVLVFVTPRRWTGMLRWANGAKRRNAAEDIRVYDARDLARWLAQAPETARWFIQEALGERDATAPETAEVTPETARQQAAELVEHWRKLGKPFPGLTDEDALPRLAALTAVHGPFDHADLRRIAETLPDLGLSSPYDAVALFLRVAVPSVPDLVAAAFVVEVLGMQPNRAPEWLWAAIDGVEADALPRLERLAYDAEVRLGIHEPQLADWLVTLVESHPDRAPRLAPHLVDYWLPVGLVPFYTAVAQSMLESAREEGERVRWLTRLAQCWWTDNNYATALPIIQEAITLGRKLAAADPERCEEGLASALYRLSVIYSRGGKFAKGLAAIRETLEIFRRLATANPARFEAELARCLNISSKILSETRNGPAALEAIREAVEIYRRLAANNPARFEADLAGSLHNLSLQLSETGDGPAALEAIREAVEIYRRLAANSPARFEADLAGCLYNLSLRMSDVGEEPAALDAICEAVRIQRRLAATDSARFEPGLAKSLRLLSGTLSKLNLVEEAHAAAQEADTLGTGTPKLPKPPHTPPPPLTIDPLRLAYLLVLDNRAPPPLLLRPDAEAMAEAMAAVEGDAGGDLDRVVAGLQERHSDAAPHPLWLAWMEETQPGLGDRLKGEIPALWAKRGGPPPPA